MDRIRRIIGIAAVAASALGAGAVPASAHHGTAERDDGLQVVRPQTGPKLTTHGRDPRPSAEDVRMAARGLPSGVGFSPGDAKRSPVCASDYYQHVIYARPASGPDRFAASRDRIRGAVKRTNAVLNAESLASGGGSADYKVLCEGGEIAVGNVVSSGGGFSAIVSAARAAGYDSGRADYLIFFDGSSGGSCGTASFSDDESLSASNANNTGGDYAVIWSDCWETHIPMHEGGHMMGAVQYGAPHSTGSGSHCNEENDVMCYSPDGGDRNQGGTRLVCSGESRFDCGFDDYFDSAPEPGEYLASHWNVGSGLNRFISFGPRDTSLIDTLAGNIQALLSSGKKSGSGSAVAGGPGAWKLFKIDVTRAARTLRVRVEHPPSAPLSLYVRRMKQPTASSYRCRARASRGTTTTCRLPHPERGRWYAGVQSTGAAGTPFRIKASLAPRR